MLKKPVLPCGQVWLIVVFVVVAHVYWLIVVQVITVNFALEGELFDVVV